MNDTPAEHLDQEPQEDRGPTGSRDTGSDEPSGGPADRPAGTIAKENETTVDPKDPIDDAMADLPPSI